MVSIGLLCSLANCWSSPIRRNSVLELFKVNRFAVVQAEIIVEQQIVDIDIGRLGLLAVDL